MTVNDGIVNSVPDTVTVTTLGGNMAPVANAGPDQTMQMGTAMTLDGSMSKDADGNVLTFQWALTTKPIGSTAALSDPGAMRPTFTADLSGEYIAQLIVNDGTVSSTPDTVIIKTSTLPQASGVYIARAKWNASTGKLAVVGRAPKNATVEIIDADSATLLTTVTAGDTGRFRAYITPPFIPCTIQAAANGRVGEKTPVAGAPAACGVNGGSPVVQEGQEREKTDYSLLRRKRMSR